MKLNDLKPQAGSKSERKRVGRGPGAGQGKTAGRGTKGQNARSGGGTRLYHQGGNLPFFRRLPFKRGEGFTPFTSQTYNEVNLDQLSGFPAQSEVNPVTLAVARLLRDVDNPVAILGRGKVSVPLKVRAQRVTAGARAKIEAAGGSVELIDETVTE